MTKAEQQALVAIPVDEIAPVTPMAVLQEAVKQGANVDTLAKLLELVERREATEAKRAFSEAMDTFKANPPEILKNRHVRFETSKGITEYDHATLDHVCDAVADGLSKVGISHRWKVRQTPEVITVVCVLTHRLGHSEETEISGCPDTSGGKNAIQAIASSVTYLERYSLMAAAGVAAKNTDNDGQGAPGWDKLQEFVDSISTAPGLAVLERTFKDAFKEAMAGKHTKAMVVLAKAKDARKAELQKEGAE